MRIQNTELDCEEHNEIALDYFLGGEGETKEQWAQRVWDCCRRQSEGEDIARVYKAKAGQTWQQRAHELWENKKKRRCEALCREMGIKEASTPERLKQLKKDPKYKTKAQRHQEELARMEVESVQ